MEISDKIPFYINVLIVLTALTVALTFWLGVTQVAKRIDMPQSSRTKVSIWLTILLLTWLVIAPTLAIAFAPHLPSLREGAPHNGMLLLILAPIIGGVWLLRVPVWRQIVNAVPQHWIIGIQVYRVIGVVFLPLTTLEVLPAYFSIPAGYGDLISGIPAPIVAYLAWKSRGLA